MQDEELNKKIDERIKMIIPQYLKTSAFIDRKLTDTPTDAYQVVPRKYVTANGVVASRPVSSVATTGQSYFATDTGIPMRFDGTDWRNGVGSIVALGL